MPSRRQFLRATALAGVAAGPGCSGLAASGGERTATGESDGETADVDPSVRLTVVDGDREVELATAEDFESVGTARKSDRGSGYGVPATLTESGVREFTEGFRAVEAADAPSEHELTLYVDGEREFSAPVAPTLAEDIERGEWEGEFRLIVEDEATAERIRSAIERS